MAHSSPGDLRKPASNKGTKLAEKRKMKMKNLTSSVEGRKFTKNRTIDLAFCKLYKKSTESVQRIVIGCILLAEKKYR